MLKKASIMVSRRPRTLLLATLLLLALGKGTLWSQSSADPPPDGTLVTYHAFDGTTYTLRHFSGLYVALLINDAQLAVAGEGFVRRQIDRYDHIYDSLKDFLGSEPAGSGLLRIAVLPQGQAGDGAIGAKGCEITHLFFDDPNQLGRDLLYEVVKHEMIHNFDLYSTYLFNNPDPFHSWTDFMQLYAGVYLREGFTDQSLVAPDDWLRIIADRFFGAYLSTPSHSWEGCVQASACDGKAMAQHAQGGVALRVVQLYGPSAMRNWYPTVRQLITSRSLSPSTMSTSDRVDFLFETLSDAVGDNLSCFADSIRWPVSESVRARLSMLPKSRYCDDKDGDGYSPLLGDFNDNNSTVHPLAAEIADGLDNDLNGAVDEVLISETSPFPNQIDKALLVPWPVRITGTLTGNTADHWHFFRINLGTTSSIRFQLKSTGAFNGYIQVYNPDGSGYSAEYTEGPYGPTDLTLSFTPGEWKFSVNLCCGPSNGPGTYELVVAPAAARVDPLLFAAPPTGRPNGQIRLSVPRVAQQLVSRSDTVRFWISKYGWVGSSPIIGAGSVFFDWTPPAAADLSKLRYTVQYFKDNLPSSAVSPEVPLSASVCNFGVAPTLISVPASGGSAALNVNANDHCEWQVSVDSPWISIAAANGTLGNGNGNGQPGGWGSGSRVLYVYVDANTGPRARTGTLALAGQTVVITQSASDVGISTPRIQFSWAVGSDAPGAQPITVGSGGSFSWTAASNVAWLVLSPRSGTVPSASSLSISVDTSSHQIQMAGRYSGNVTISTSGSAVELSVILTVLPAELSFAGSMAQIASGGGWDTTFTLLNTGAALAEAHLKFFGNDGTPVQLPFAFPQAPLPGPLIASTLDQPLTANSLLVLASQQPSNANAQVGSAQLLTNAHVGGFAIFKYTPTGQEAVVPLETRNAPSYVLAFDNTGVLGTGVAIANVATQAANIPVVIRDDTGAELGRDTIKLAAEGHTSFMLIGNYAITAGKRGTMEFDTPASGQISVLGLRASGSALTTLPVLANVAAGGGSMAQVASGGGWQTTFTLVNTGTSAAQAQLNFFDNDGSAFPLPLTFVQSGAAMTASTLSQTIAAGATLVILTQGSNAGASLVGSAQLTTSGSVSGFAIFRYNPTGQEAVVPLETSHATAYVLAFDNTNGLATGLALANVSNQAAKVPVVFRDDTGANLGTATINLAARGHTSFVLTDHYSFAAGKRGTVEFDTPAGGEVSVLGLRATPAGAVTTIPVLTK